MANKASYNGKPIPLAITRIASDRNMVTIDKKGYESSDIYFDFDTPNIDTKFRILMVGSRDIPNPYMGGFFMFSGNYPDQYPFFPPHIQAMTQGKHTRFHPNFYVNGKCCVSILGTWSGPPWTSCQNMGTVAQTLKSLYIENPITQEPGWEDCKDSRSKIYKRIVEYRTLEVAVLQMLHNPPKGYEGFLTTMETEFLKFWPKYCIKLDELEQYDGNKYISPIYNMTIVFDIKGLRNDFEDMYCNLHKKYGSGDNDEIKSDENTIDISAKKYQRQCPNDMAKTMDIGTEKLSENDGNVWIVKQNKSKNNYWAKSFKKL